MHNECKEHYAYAHCTFILEFISFIVKCSISTMGCEERHLYNTCIQDKTNNFVAFLMSIHNVFSCRNKTNMYMAYLLSQAVFQLKSLGNSSGYISHLDLYVN